MFAASPTSNPTKALSASRAPSPADRSRQRKIIHIDMDAFYASVEQRDNPALRGKPVAVGGSRERGVVAAASYEARRYGVHSAMPSVTAKRKCPDLIFVPPRFEAYRAVSRQIHEIFAKHTPLIEPLSLDEAYLDVTDNLQGLASATEVAEAIRAEINSVTQLTASAGISYNKFLAKTASGQNKPDGLFVITPSIGPSFVENLPVRKFHGVGPATAAKMNGLGIETGLDLQRCSLGFLRDHFGKAGSYYYWISRAIDARPVQPNRARKSIGTEDTFAHDLFTFDEAQKGLRPLIQRVWRHCAANNTRGRTVTLKVKYGDFQLITRSRTLSTPLVALPDLERIAISLLEALFPARKGIRLLGITLSSLGEDIPCNDRQFSLDV